MVNPLQSLRTVACLIAGLAVLASMLFAPIHAAHACTIDGIATASANGIRAIPSPAPRARKAAPIWAPFTFAGRYRARTPITFTEDRAQLAQALPAEVMRRGWRWRFGDGTSAFGWAVRHTYARPGHWRVMVEAYVPGSGRQQWYPFDQIMIVISHGGSD